MKTQISDKELFDSTLQLLRVRMRRKGDFPSLGRSIQRIQDSMRSDKATDEQLVEAILSDLSLTQKTLRLANSAMYASFGEKVATVTQALHVIGTETVGHLATSLKLMDQLESAASTSAAKGELSRSAAAGMVSRKIAASVSGMDGEEASVSTLLHRLGWLLVTFYLPEQAEAIRRHVDAGRGEHECELETLGAPAWLYGKEMGKEWGLPEALCAAMNPQPDESDPHALWVASVSGFSREFVEATSQGKDSAVISAIAARYAQRIGCDEGVLLSAAAEVAESEEAKAFVKVVAEAAAEADLAVKPSDATARLDEALRDLRHGAGTLRVDQVVSMATELVHRSIGFQRTVFFLRSTADKAFKVKIALGDGADGTIQRLSFEEAFSPNVFHLALSNRKSVFIANATEAGIRKRMPTWYVDALSDVQSFLLVPVCLGSQPIGLLYADWGENSRGSSVDAEDLSRIETIRSCMVAAFERLASAPARKAA